MKNSISRQIILSIIGIALLLVAVLGVSYAIQIVFVDENSNMITTPSIHLSINNKRTDQLFFRSLKPLSDSYALSDKYHNSFELLVSSKVPSNEKFYYEVALVPNHSFDSIVKIAIYENEVQGYQLVADPIFVSELENSSLHSDEYLLYSGVFLNTETRDIHYYKKLKLRLWLSNDSTASYNNVSYSVRVYAKKIN